MYNLALRCYNNELKWDKDAPVYTAGFTQIVFHMGAFHGIVATSLH